MSRLSPIAFGVGLWVASAAGNGAGAQSPSAQSTSAQSPPAQSPAAPLPSAQAATDALSVVANGVTNSMAHGVSTNAAAPARARPVVVLIPGTIGSSFSMRHVTRALAEAGIATVVIDPLGMGTSARPETADYSLSRQADRIGRILDSLRVSDAVVVGQGTSATIALHLAANDSVPAGRSRVAGVLSLAGGPVDKQGTRGVKLALTLAPVLDNALGRALGRRKFRAAVKEQSASDAWCTDSVLRVYLAPYERDLRGSLRALRAMHETVEPVPIARRLPGVRVPVRLLVGDKASGSAPTDAQIALLTQTLTRFRVDTVPRAGTMLQEEQPAAVVQAIRQLIVLVARP